MRIMTRMGTAALEQLGESDDFNRGIHCTLDLNPERRLICHFPQDNTIISVGSGYGGNALLSKKCFALRIASSLGRDEGWFAEHMLILGLQSPEGETTYVAAAFPSACGKTNLAMLTPPAEFKGWKVFTVGDDISWMRVGPDGGLWAVNPENGYFGVAPGHQRQVESERDEDGRARYDFHQRRDDCGRRRVVGRDGRAGARGPARLAGTPVETRLDRQSGASQQPLHDSDAQQSGAGRRRPTIRAACRFPRSSSADAAPRRCRWCSNRSTGPTAFSSAPRWVPRPPRRLQERSASLRRDPMAMLPFCGYNIGDYFAHWLKMRSAIKKPPRIFMVNWFRKGADGNFIWPGYGENLRVLKWMLDQNPRTRARPRDAGRNRSQRGRARSQGPRSIKECCARGAGGKSR